MRVCILEGVKFIKRSIKHQNKATHRQTNSAILRRTRDARKINVPSTVVPTPKSHAHGQVAVALNRFNRPKFVAFPYALLPWSGHWISKIAHQPACIMWGNEGALEGERRVCMCVCVCGDNKGNRERNDVVRKRHCRVLRGPSRQNTSVLAGGMAQ